MNQQEFVARYETQWKQFERVLKQLSESRRSYRLSPVELGDFPIRYRQLCQQLALARDRDYAAYLIDRLNVLVLGGHQFLYESRSRFWFNFIQGVIFRFPNQVRRDIRLFCLAALLLFGPAIGIGVGILNQPNIVYAVLEPAMVDQFEKMYDPSERRFGVEAEKSSHSNFRMFGFYIRNNIGVGFRTFAGGILVGIGTAALLIFNGIFFGAAATHLTLQGAGNVFWSFVIGHGALELTAIVLAGTAGLKLGFSLIAPGRLTRSRALREAARDSMHIVYGFIFMLVLAAFIEAFWSSTTAVSFTTKYVVGTCLWIAVAAYFVLMGRERGY